MKEHYKKTTAYIKELAELSSLNNHITPDMYPPRKVNRGLRDLNGNGVVTGLTEVSSITAKKHLPDGRIEPAP